MKTKAAIRDALKDARQEPTSGSQDNILGALVGVLQALRINRASISVLSYKAVERWHEIDVAALPERLPEVHFDTVENVENVPFPTEKYDAVIVPLFGFNAEGYRLGHGGGWYDKFLAAQPQALKIGVGYENTLVDFEPETHDVRMDVVITEKNVRDFR